jgi:hypothetical protein
MGSWRSQAEAATRKEVCRVPPLPLCLGWWSQVDTTGHISTFVAVAGGTGNAYAIDVDPTGTWLVVAREWGGLGSRWEARHPSAPSVALALLCVPDSAGLRKYRLSDPTDNVALAPGFISVTARFDSLGNLWASSVLPPA